MPISNNPGTDPTKNPAYVQIDGTDITGATQPAGGAGARGWLSAIWTALTTGIVVNIVDPVTASKKLRIITSGSMPVVDCGYGKQSVAKGSAVNYYSLLSGSGYLNKIWNASENDFAACKVSLYDSNTANGVTPSVDPFMKSVTLTGGQILEFKCFLNNGLVIGVENGALNADGGVYATLAGS